MFFTPSPMASFATSLAVVVPLAPPAPTPSPSSTPPRLLGGGCVPGRDGIPAGPFGHLMCGDYLAHAPAALWHTARGWCPLLLTVALAVLAARLLWAWWPGTPGGR